MNYKLLIVFCLSTILALSTYSPIVEALPWNEADYPAEYSAKKIKARIVDADTGEPIENAVVVAQWILRDLARGRKDVSDRLEVLEAVTDKGGWFYIPAWGPKKRPTFTLLENHDPEILVFKSGYKTLFLLNANKEFLREMYKINFEEIDSDKLDDLTRNITSEKKIPTGPIRESIWNGKTIKLHKPKDEKDYWWSLSQFQSDIGWSGDNTNWISIKNAVREIEKARKTLPQKYIWYLPTLPDNARKIIYGEDNQ